MHGRSLVRTLDAGVIVIVTIAIALLCLLAWTTRSMDRMSFENESSIVRRELGKLIAEFRSELPEPAARTAEWVDARPQVRAALVKKPEGYHFQSRAGSRIAALLHDDLSESRLRQAHAALAKLDPQRRRVDFVLIGPAGDESLALLAQMPGTAAEADLAVALVDLSALAIDLEMVSIGLLPLVGSEEVPKSTNGRITIDGVSGETIATLAWNSKRVSTVISHTILPILAGCLAVGLTVLMMLRHYWSVARDGFVKDLKTVEAIAHTDALTGLPNRRALFEHLRKAAPPTEAFPPITVLMLDLDGFKWINDHVGHQAGDRVLAQAAGVFRDEIGKSGFVARIGGDEFIAVLPGVIIGSALQSLHRHLTENLRERVPVEGGVQIGVSIGAASSADYTGDGEDLMKLADLAVYSAKAAGRGIAMAYEPSMKQEKAYRRNVERELRGAMLTNSLFLAHQPIVDALSGTVLGYESLVRWQHPARGVISPGEFIPIAEKSDLIVTIGNYVLDRALLELGSRGQCRISVNATGRQLLSENFVVTVQNLLKRHGVDAGRLCLELTETSLITERDRVAEVMAELQGLGVKFAIDDFGAGYSSLNYLLRFKFDVLKIDRDFIIGLDD